MNFPPSWFQGGGNFHWKSHKGKNMGKLNYTFLFMFEIAIFHVWIYI